MSYAGFDINLNGKSTEMIHAEATSNGGFLKNTLQKLLESYERYNRIFDAGEPGFWGFIQ